MDREVAGVLPLEKIIHYLSGLSWASKLEEFPILTGMYKPLWSIMDLLWKNSYDFVNFKDKKGTKIKDWHEIKQYRSPKGRKKDAAFDKVLEFLRKNPDFFGLGDNQELI
jgi:hypothetical protein